MRPVLLAPATIVEACPGCHRPTSDSATLGTANGFVVATPTRQFTQPPYEIRQCQRCGLMYRTPRPAETELDAYYRSDAFDNFENIELFPTERVVREILNRLPRGARVLDFGCNTGRLMASFVGHFECFGIELNPAAGDVARRRDVCVTALAELS